MSIKDDDLLVVHHNKTAYKIKYQKLRDQIVDGIGGGGGDANHSDGPTAPTTGDSGDQWFNTDDGRLYTYTEDSSGTLVWIDASPDSIGGGSGDGTTINYNGASAWGSVAEDGTLKNGLNSTTAEVQTGTYRVTFLTPMSNDTYGVNATTEGVGYTIAVKNKTINSCEVEIRNSGDSSRASKPFDFAVFSSNAIAPQSGVGADAWVIASGSSAVPDADKIKASYNVASVVRESTGVYRVTYITPMPIAEYSAVAGSVSGGGRSVTVTQITASSLAVNIVDDNGTAIDGTFTLAVHASSTVTPTYTWTRDGTTLKPANDGDDVEVAGDLTLKSPDAIELNIERPGQDVLSTGIDNDGPYLTAGTHIGFRINGGAIGNETVRFKNDGSATFGGSVELGTWDPSGDSGSGVRLARGTQNGEVNFGIVQLQQSTSSNPVAQAISVHRGTSLVWSVNYSGAAGFSNVILNLDSDNVSNYVSTTNAEGETESVYNGPTLDVKALLLTLQTAAARIATLEAKVATLESDHTTLMNNNNNGGGY